jgi:hypothetical protein
MLFNPAPLRAPVLCQGRHQPAAVLPQGMAIALLTPTNSKSHFPTSTTSVTRLVTSQGMLQHTAHLLMRFHTMHKLGLQGTCRCWHVHVPCSSPHCSHHTAHHSGRQCAGPARQSRSSPTRLQLFHRSSGCLFPCQPSCMYICLDLLFCWSVCPPPKVMFGPIGHSPPVVGDRAFGSRAPVVPQLLQIARHPYATSFRTGCCLHQPVCVCNRHRWGAAP